MDLGPRPVAAPKAAVTRKPEPVGGRRVVAGVDGSPSALEAVRWAADDTARRDRVLRLVHVTAPWAFDLPLDTPPGFQESLSERSHEVLAEAADLARDRVPGLRVETVPRTGNVRGELLDESRDAEELVVGGRGFGGFLGLVLGSVSMGVAGHARCPVIVTTRRAGSVHDRPAGPESGSASGGEPTGGQERVHGEIVVGHDGSPESDAALEYAFEEADLRGAGLRAIYAWQVAAFLPMFASYTPDLERVFDFGRRAAQERLLRWKEKYPQINVLDTVVDAHPVEALSEASSAADLLVVGSRGRSALGAALLGSVGHGVLHHARCPVAIVRSRHPSPPAASPPP